MLSTEKQSGMLSIEKQSGMLYTKKQSGVLSTEAYFTPRNSLAYTKVKFRVRLG